jgi:hypothetical protein
VVAAHLAVAAMSFNLDDYEPVELRVAKFWERHPDGRILTQLEQTSEVGYIVAASVYRTAADERPAATGWAQEHVTAKGVNSTSALENCETSAIGRALANLGFAAKANRPSREEMEKTQRGPADPRVRLFSAIKAAGEKLGWSQEDIESDYAHSHDGQNIRDASADVLALYLEALTHPKQEAPA